MATFGAPVKDPDHVTNALRAGLEVFGKIKELESKKIIPPTKVGIGVHTGTVVTGNIGNETRKQFSISGSPVIIAARLESLTKEYSTPFLVSKEVYVQANGKFCCFSKLGEVKVKNIDRAIEVYKVEVPGAKNAA